jgi:hypothetical protein
LAATAPSTMAARVTKRSRIAPSISLHTASVSRGSAACRFGSGDGRGGLSDTQPQRYSLRTCPREIHVHAPCSRPRLLGGAVATTRQ